MKFSLKEPLYARYLYLSPENIVHVFMPVVSGTAIGLDNTCKAVYSLQEFFDKGSNSNTKMSLKSELLAYKVALENDLSLLGKNSPLSQQKQERLTQINAYLEAVKHLEKHPELDCLNEGFPSYPRPLEVLMQSRDTSNLYSMVLRPTVEDGFLRSEAANPIFSVAHKSVARGIEQAVSPFQQALIQAYTSLVYKSKDLKSQVMEQALARLKPIHMPVDFERLRQILKEVVKTQLNAVIDFTKDQKGKSLNQHDIDTAMKFDTQTTHQEYVDALFFYCAPNLFDNTIESPFNYLTQAEQWSIATQFLLGLTNIYCVAQGKISPDINLGRILDGSPDLSKNLAQTLAQAQQNNQNIEDACFAWMNKHAKKIQLTSLTPKDMKAIKDSFALRYAEIKDAPHFDEFFLLDTQKKGSFVVHQGSICTSFANFARSPLLDLPQELAQSLEKARSQVPSLGTEIPHKSHITQEAIDINLATLDHPALQALYEQITTYKDPKLKEHLLAQFKQERPDFKAQIDAKKFVQCVAYGEQDEAEALLKEDINRAQELLTASATSFTDYSGRTFTCTAYEYAYWAKDTHMCRMLEKYMDNYTKHELLKRVQRMEEPTGPEFIKQPRGLAYIQNGTEHRSAHFDLTPLKQALKAYIDVYAQSPKRSRADWYALEALWLKVGLSQRDVPAHIAQEYCHPTRSFIDVVDNPTILDASNPSNLSRQLKFFNWETHAYDAWFTRTTWEDNSGLGVSFAIFRWASGDGSGRGVVGTIVAVDSDLLALETIDEVRTKDLKQSLERLAASSSLAPNILHVVS